MNKFIFELIKICKKDRQGSYSTRKNRLQILSLVERELREIGFRHLVPQTMKGKHVQGLVLHWTDQGLSVGTIKNRMAALRWLLDQVNRGFIIPRRNADLAIPRRTFTNNGVNDAKRLDHVVLREVNDEFVRLSLRMQEHFGLRMEESIKFCPGYADKGDHIFLKDTWCKGKRARSVPIRTHEQRELLNQIKTAVRNGSLIPKELRYIDQKIRYESELRRVGFKKMHGLRHQYAQDRFKELTGFNAPKAGGPTRKQMTDEQRQLDWSARLVISRELGHQRVEITNVYLGS